MWECIVLELAGVALPCSQNMAAAPPPGLEPGLVISTFESLTKCCDTSDPHFSCTQYYSLGLGPCDTPHRTAPPKLAPAALRPNKTGPAQSDLPDVKGARETP